MNDDGYFGDSVAARYDAVHGGSDTKEVRMMVDKLYKLANGGNALEFAIGTGRVGIPLHQRGCDVKGIELSTAMTEELRKKSSIEVTVGDMTTTQVDGDFSLVFLVYNTIDNLTTQDAQIACFKNASAHLEKGGRFVIETLVPPIQKVPYGESLLAFNLSDEHWGIDEFDVVTQQYSSHHMRLIDGTFQSISVPFRYAWPSEMDLMAKSAGLELEQRWSDWIDSPFDKLSKSHISVWKKS